MSDCLWPHGVYSPWNSPGQYTRVGGLSLLQGIFPTQGWNPGLLHCKWILYQLSQCWPKKLHNVRGENYVLFGGKMSSSVQETAPQIALRDCSKEAVREGQYIKFWWRRSSMQSSAYFTKGFLLGTYITMKEVTNFSIYEEMQGLGSSPPWIPLRGCWRPEAIAAQGSVSTETNGKCPCWWSCVC